MIFGHTFVTPITSLFSALLTGLIIVIVTLSCILILSQIVRLHHPPLPQPHEVHLAAVGGSQDVPLVDQTPPADKGFLPLRDILSAEQCQEGKLSNPGVFSSNDKPGRFTRESTFFLLQRRSVGGKVAADLLLSRVTNQCLQFVKLCVPSWSLFVQFVQFLFLLLEGRTVLLEDTVLSGPALILTED